MIVSPVELITVTFLGQTYNFSDITFLKNFNEIRTYYDSQRANGYVIIMRKDNLITGTSVNKVNQKNKK